METEDMMDNEKKSYNTPELLEHGNLMELTQGEQNGYTDTLGGGSIVERPPFIILP